MQKMIPVALCLSRPKKRTLEMRRPGKVHSKCSSQDNQSLNATQLRLPFFQALCSFSGSWFCFCFVFSQSLPLTLFPFLRTLFLMPYVGICPLIISFMFLTMIFIHDNDAQTSISQPRWCSPRS